MPQRQRKREILHFAFGPSSCGVVAHWTNLQGLASTTASDGGGGGGGDGGDRDRRGGCCCCCCCEAGVTDAVNLEGVIVPRVLLVDYPEASAFVAQPQPSSPPPNSSSSSPGSAGIGSNRQKQLLQLQGDHEGGDGGEDITLRMAAQQQRGAPAPPPRRQQEDPRMVVAGGIDVRDVGRIDRREISSFAAAAAAAAQQLQSRDPFDDFFRTASAMASNQHSRYQCRGEGGGSRSAPSYSSKGRHVNWDEEEGEEGDGVEGDEEDEEELHRRRRDDWRRSFAEPSQKKLDDFWSPYFHRGQRQQGDNNVGTKDEVGGGEDAAASSTPSSAAAAAASATTPTLSWRNFFMPPYQPQSILPLPFRGGGDSDGASSSSSSYYAALNASEGSGGCGGDSSSLLSAWSADLLDERIRKILEDCDSCQGVVASCDGAAGADGDGGGIFAGLTTHALRYLADECPSAKKWVLPVAASSRNLQQVQHPADPSSSSWRTNKVRALRWSVESGLSLHQHVELSDAILPLEIPAAASAKAGVGVSAFAASAYVAAALETATLPYRLRDSDGGGGLIGLNSYYQGSFGGSCPFGTASSVSLADFLNTLKPSAKHSVLELDSLLPTSGCSVSGGGGGAEVWSKLRQGTSIERDPRMPPDRHSSSSNSPPGTWLDPIASGGLLSPLSPTTNGGSGGGAAGAAAAASLTADRLQHHHFALSAALRPVPTVLHSSGSNRQRVSTQQYVTCLMEGMGVRYRPEQSMACAVGQSFGDLVRDGYAAGSYWKYLWGNSGSTGGIDGVVVLSAIGNTSRSFYHLNRTAADLKDSLSPKQRGFYSRDVMNGLLPEADDCDESLSFCLDLRDTYRPPEGRGLMGIDDDEGADHFDDD